MKKKLFLVVTILGLFFLLTGCVGAQTGSSMVITSLEGAGTKTITVTIEKDRASEQDVDANGNPKYYEDGTPSMKVYNNGTYFPKGYQAVVDFIQAKIPEEVGMTITLDETSNTQQAYIRLEYSFTSFADYTQKTKLLVGEDVWQQSAFVDPQR